MDEALAELEKRKTIEKELVDDAQFMYKELDPAEEAGAPRAAATRVVSIPVNAWRRDLATTFIDKIWSRTTAAV